MSGIPWCPTSPPYSLISQDFDKLKHVVKTLTPGLVFASDASRYARAMLATLGEDVELVCTEGTVPGRDTTSFAALLATEATAAVDAAMAATGPDTVVKFLFTSGSTKMPKAVINTQRMWCANQQQMTQSMPVLTEGDLVLVDWLPWNHTFGGNHNFGMVIYNGGTLYIDDGKPTPALMAETLRNLREIAPTVYFNVPTGFEAIANAMKSDDRAAQDAAVQGPHVLLRRRGPRPAYLGQPVRERGARNRPTHRHGHRPGHDRVRPLRHLRHQPQCASRRPGPPHPGLELKLVDTDGKTEVRYRGPNITPGYWRMPAETADAFDEEGFFKTGDAVRWIDETDIHQGLKFDGRIAEDFKLATGTFVSVGPLRGKIIAAGAPYIQDVVLTGLNMKEVGAMVFPTPAVRQLSSLPADASLHDVLDDPGVLAHFQTVVDELARASTGSANRIARLCLLADPPTIDRGEITDKGSINQRSVLTHRADTVAKLHADELRYILKPSV
jgi:feruloyl-CoA synthase